MSSRGSKQFWTTFFPPESLAFTYALSHSLICDKTIHFAVFLALLHFEFRVFVLCGLDSLVEDGGLYQSAHFVL